MPNAVEQVKEIDRVKTEFVFIASHQLRTPLTAIKLYLEMLLDDPSMGIHPEHIEYLKNIYASTNRMVQLVDDLLNVSRIEAGTLRVMPTETNLKQFIQSVIRELEPLAKEKNCQIQFECKEVTRPIMIDQQLMHVVLHNLLSNALKYSQINICDVRVSVQKIKRADGMFVQIRVSDKGIGIPKKDQLHIFDKFFRAENALKVQTEGSGLGLYIAKMIAELSDGELVYESKQHQGSVFSLTIPFSGSSKKSGSRTIRTHKL